MTLTSLVAELDSTPRFWQKFQLLAEDAIAIKMLALKDMEGLIKSVGKFLHLIFI